MHPVSRYTSRKMHTGFACTRVGMACGCLDEIETRGYCSSKRPIGERTM